MDLSQQNDGHSKLANICFIRKAELSCVRVGLLVLDVNYSVIKYLSCVKIGSFLFFRQLSLSPKSNYILSG